MNRLIAKVGCPACGKLMARVVMEDGRVQIHHHEISLDSRPERPGGVVEVRGWQGSSTVTKPEPGKAQVTEAACRDVGCHGRLVLDSRRVVQLVAEANRRGGAIRWQPGPADVERSEAMRPAVHFTAAPGRIGPAMEAARTEPPPLLEVRRVNRR